MKKFTTESHKQFIEYQAEYYFKYVPCKKCKKLECNTCEFNYENDGVSEGVFVDIEVRFVDRQEITIGFYFKNDNYLNKTEILDILNNDVYRVIYNNLLCKDDYLKSCEYANAKKLGKEWIDNNNDKT